MPESESCTLKDVGDPGMHVRLVSFVGWKICIQERWQILVHDDILQMLRMIEYVSSDTSHPEVPFILQIFVNEYKYKMSLEDVIVLLKGVPLMFAY